jgi:hypothetical protein
MHCLAYILNERWEGSCSAWWCNYNEDGLCLYGEEDLTDVSDD